MVRFNAEGPAGLVDRKAPGPTPLLTDAHRQALAAQIDRGPIPAVHGVVRWRLCDLGQWLWEEFRVSASMQTLSREVRALGYPETFCRMWTYYLCYCEAGFAERTLGDAQLLLTR